MKATEDLDQECRESIVGACAEARDSSAYLGTSEKTDGEWRRVRLGKRVWTEKARPCVPRWAE